MFNMAVMGFRLGQRANGVSLLHGEVSREMFQGLWSSFDTSEVPISSITNGVHHPTWVHPELLELLESSSSGDTVIDGYDWAGPVRGRGRHHLVPQAADAAGSDQHGPALG